MCNEAEQIWGNPFQTEEERREIITELLSVETDADCRDVLYAVPEDRSGAIHVYLDGRMQHVYWKIREG